MDSSLISFSIFLIIGIIFVIIGIILIILEKSASKKYPAVAKGTVVQTILQQEWDHSQNSGRRYLADHYYCVVSFNGMTIQSKSPRTQIEYKDGQQVEVRYNPEHPDDFYIKGSEGIFRLVGVIMVGAGIFCILVFAGAVIYYQSH